MGLNPSFWNKRKVLVTGHTGFKGSWLSLWLTQMGAQVTGFSLEPPSKPSLFVESGLQSDIKHYHGDIRNPEQILNCILQEQPEIVFHLAAQSLVRQSYQEPAVTFETNIMGTVHVLDACRKSESVRSIVNITSDKCYENNETGQGYRESDPMGGHDPYSCSKGCAELVTSSFRRSFMQADRQDKAIALASARAGNVIGGGDWAEDRLIPDVMRALASGKQLIIRNPQSVRPWQHVLDPLHGYLVLAERLSEGQALYQDAWNFGPATADAVTVSQLLESLMSGWDVKTPYCESTEPNPPHEANMLRLDCTRAHQELDWKPLLGLDMAIQWTSEWYRAWLDKKDLRAKTLEQIEHYQTMAQESP